MKISTYDKYQALCRSELYRSDFNKYLEKRGKEKDLIVIDPPSFSAKLCDAGKWLCSKWKLGSPINPEVPYDENMEEINAVVKALTEMGGQVDSQVDLKRALMEYSLLLIDQPITYLTPPKKWQTMESRGFKDTNDKFTHVDGKLVLMINTSYSYNELEKTFKEFLKRWVKPSNERVTSSYVDKWQIYDEHIKQEKTLLDITHNLFKTERISPCEDERVDAYYQQVKRAQKKAHSIIQHLEKQAESHPTK